MSLISKTQFSSKKLYYHINRTLDNFEISKSLFFQICKKISEKIVHAKSMQQKKHFLLLFTTSLKNFFSKTYSFNLTIT